ncbi:hypothetical protein E1287_39175 [Actinomadura sp. KC06]|uniref:hypothetical protein n=1 Tax=Actinomadura sp. KC06 TaxID=2530369 RepID=UPI001051E4EF|nr:hypothetical protein [Actinomadura sp. KC06]TDD23197.1 hypothetical protein E1287_39175 [Actinomadura sp. KC06]
MSSLGRRFRRVAVPVLALTLTAGVAGPASAAGPRKVIVLPEARSAEGIAAGWRSTFYAGDMFNGDIFRGDTRRGTAGLFIDAPAGRMALGMTADLGNGLLFVAGGFTGHAYVYDIHDGSTMAIYQFTEPNAGIINDVTLTNDGAWFTDSRQAKLYFIPISDNGRLRPFRTLTLTGPAADTSGPFNNNGISTTPDGTGLIVAHTARGVLNIVNPGTGTSETMKSVPVPNVDGLVRDGRTLWAVQFNRAGGERPQAGQISRIRLSYQSSSAVLEKVILSDEFQVPTTAAKFGDRLGVVNAKFNTGFPPTAKEYEVVVVDS